MDIGPATRFWNLSTIIVMSSVTNSHQTHKDSRWRWLAGAALACLLLGFYLVTWRPIPSSADGISTLAVTTSLVRHSRADIEAFAATDAQSPMDAARMGVRGPDGALYTKKGLTPSLALLPLVALSEIVPAASAQAAAMLLNPLVTTATALAVYVLVLRLGYRLRTAFAVGLVYGLATLALPYTTTLFGEPLAGLLLILAIIGLTHGRSRGAALAGVCGGLLAGVNMAYVVTLAALGALALAAVWPNRAWRRLVVFGVAAAVPLLIIGLYNTARFGGPLETGYHFAQGEGFTVNPLFGAYGLLLSPYKGILWYSPVIILSLIGWPFLRRREPLLAWSTAGFVVLQVILFSAWWSWHGGITWGPRFLVPVLPLLAVWLAPVVERSWTSRPWRVAVAVPVVLSIGAGALGTLVGYQPYIAYLTHEVWGGDFAGVSAGHYDWLVSDWGLSPLVGHLALLLGGWPPDGASSIVQVVAGAGLIVLGTGLAWLAYRRRGPARALVALASGAAVGACVAVVLAQRETPDARQIAALAEAMQPPGVVLAETTVFGDRLLDLHASFRLFSANAPNTPDDPDAAGTWAEALETSGPFWLLTWFPQCDPANWMETELRATSAFIAERPVAGHRAVGFYRAPDPDMQPVGAKYGDITLEGAGASVRDDGVLVALDWRAEQTPEQDSTWFVHLLNPSGEIVAQQDRAPVGGCRPANEWKPGESMTDRLFFPVSGAGEGWALRVGWVNSATAELQPVTSADGAPLDTPYMLIPLGTG